MTKEERDLGRAILDPGFTPSVRDAERLFGLLTSADDELADAAERCLARIGAPLVNLARKYVQNAHVDARVRARVCRAIGKNASSEEAATYLIDALADADPKTRRNAIVALGKVRDARVEAALLGAWTDDVRVDHQRSLAASLGKIGGADALAKLRAVKSDDAELTRISAQARIMIERTHSRADTSEIDADARSDRAHVIAFHCREGLEDIVIDELTSAGHGWNAHVAGKGRVEATLNGPLSKVFAARTMTHVTFVLPAPRSTSRDRTSIEDAVTRAITSDAARAIFHTWTRGAIRYRLAWTRGGHKRALVWKIARGVAAIDSSLINDPTDTTWEIAIAESRSGAGVELRPRALVDPRFAYRVADIPAASHPTLAAAIARVAEARPDDVAWDPFVGSAVDLVERARLGPYAALSGTDIDPRAIDAARANVAAAKIANVTLAIADARDFKPPRALSLILTNPPMGRRVLPGENLAALLDRIVDRAAELLAPEGRLVWLSPIASHTRSRASSRGLTLEFAREVDMGGFHAELQKFRRR